MAWGQPRAFGACAGPVLSARWFWMSVVISHAAASWRTRAPVLKSNEAIAAVKFSTPTPERSVRCCARSLHRGMGHLDSIAFIPRARCRYLGWTMSTSQTPLSDLENC